VSVAIADMLSEPVLAFISLGSNLGQRADHLLRARDALDTSSGVRVMAASRIYETAPVGPGDQGPYLNAVLGVTTERSALDLLARMLCIERAEGRDRDIELRWGPRTLDLDLLMYGDACISLPGLEVPHPRLHERAFVLEPLCELAADREHPRLGGSLRQHRDRCREPDAVRVFDAEPRWQCGASLSDA
jgi:2-amino-4-hydroxy-6-hydroxymethyldihydropteridine diphosphokinase